MRTRTPARALAVAASTALLLSACADGGDGDRPGGGTSLGSAQDNAKLVSDNPQDRANLKEGGTFTVAVGDWTTNFNPFHVDGGGAEFAQIVNATDPWLYLWAPDGTMSPRTDYLTQMPTSEERDGKVVVTYRLNPKATWNDGTPIDHTAFEATWKAQRASMDKSGYNNVSTAGYEDIESVAKGAAPGEVVVTFARPFYPVTEVFQSLLHPKLGASGAAFNTLMKSDFHPELRSGPFTLDTINQTTKTIVLKANPTWWGAKPLLDKVVFRQMEDSASIPAFTSGEIDWTGAVMGVANKARLAQIQGARDLDLRRSQRIATGVLLFNGKADGISDVTVRKAIWQAIDREEWKKVRFAGLDYTEKPVNSAFYFTFQPQAEDNMPVTFDVEAAKKTLTDAGYAPGPDGIMAKGGTKVSAKYTYFSDDPLQTALAQLVQGQVKKAGIELVLDNRPAAAFGTTMEKRDFGIIAMGWSSNTSSPLTGVCQLLCSDVGSNYTGLGTPELDKKIRALGTIKDPAAQAKAINAAERDWMAATYGQLPMSNGPVIDPFRKGIANIGPALFASMHPQWENVGWQK